jgi:hypothetical protein
MQKPPSSFDFGWREWDFRLFYFAFFASLQFCQVPLAALGLSSPGPVMEYGSSEY